MASAPEQLALLHVMRRQAYMLLLVPVALLRLHHQLLLLLLQLSIGHLNHPMNDQESPNN